MRIATCSAIALTLQASVVAVAQPIAATRGPCGAIGMSAYSALNDDLGPGTLYSKLGNSGPQSSLLKCRNVFDSMKISDADRINGDSFIGDSTGGKTVTAGLGISFLKGLIGTSSDAKVDASLNRGDTWTSTLGPMHRTGVTQLTAQEYTFSTNNTCSQRIRALLRGRQKANISVIYQAASTDNIEYTVSEMGSVGGTASINIGPFVSINPTYKVEKPATNKLKVSGKPVNVCYAKLDMTIRADPRSSANRFVLAKP